MCFLPTETNIQGQQKPSQIAEILHASKKKKNLEETVMYALGGTYTLVKCVNEFCHLQL